MEFRPSPEHSEESVRKLHEVSGKGVAECAQALALCDGHLESAMLLLFEDGAFASAPPAPSEGPAKAQNDPSPGASPSAAPADASPRPAFRFGGSPAPAPAEPDASPRPVFKFGGSPAPAAVAAVSEASARPTFRFGSTGSVNSEAESQAAGTPSPRPVFRFGGAPAPAPAVSELLDRPAFRFGPMSSESESPPAAATLSPVFRFGAKATPAPAPAPAAAPAAPATPSMPTLRRKVEEKQATKAMLEQMGERTDTIDFEIAKLLSIISREEQATPTVTNGADDGSQGGETAESPLAGAGTPSPRPVFRFGAGGTPAPAPVPVAAPAPRHPFASARLREPNGLSTALGHLVGMGFVESEARAALLATHSQSIGQREIEQATHMLLSGAVPDADDHSPFGGYDRTPFGGSYCSRDEDQWVEPGAEDGFDASDAAATMERIEQLMNLVAPNDRYRTDEYQTCYRILMEKESVQWSVPQAADWLFSRAGGEDSPIGPVLDTLPVMFRVRAPDPLDIAAGQELVRAGSGSGRNDIVWEWERRGGATFGRMGVHPDMYDENGRPDPDRWGEYSVEAMAMLDVEWAKGEGARGATLVRSGGSEYLVDLNQMTQTDVDQDHTGMEMGLRPARRRIRRRFRRGRTKPGYARAVALRSADKARVDRGGCATTHARRRRCRRCVFFHRRRHNLFHGSGGGDA